MSTYYYDEATALTDVWTALGVTYAIRRQTKRGRPVDNWYVQFYKPAEYGFRFSRWKVGSAKGGFESKQQAEAWVQALCRLGVKPWEKTSS